MVDSHEQMTHSTRQSNAPDASETVSAAAQSVLDFSELNTSLDTFLKRFHDYVHSAVAENESGHSKGEMQRKFYEDRVQELERSREASKAAQKELWETVATERDQDARLRASLQALHVQSASLTQRTAELQADVAELRARVKVRQEQREEQAARLKLQVLRNAPERIQLERLTGCHVEPAREGVLKFVFSLLTPRDPSRTVSVFVDVSRARYTVPEYDTIPEATMQSLVRTLNQTGNFYAFITGVRKVAYETLAEP